MGIVYETPKKAVKAKHALLIGIEKFEDKAIDDLAGVKRDLDKFNKLLSDPSFSDFSVTKIANKKTREVKKAISQVCEQAGEDDVIFLFYAGHGLMNQEKSYFLLCSDSEYAYLDATCIAADFVLSQFRKSLCRNFIVIIDSCYSGAFFNNNHGIPNGLVALTACNENEVALETAEGGMFSNIIINGLRSEYVDADRDGKITFSELFDYITAQFEVLAPNSGRPRKWEWNVHEDICLVNSPRPVFISYKRSQTKFVNRLSKALNQRDVATFVDQEKIRLGDDWKKLLGDTIKNSRAFLFIVSEDVMHSEVAMWELAFAHKNNVPVLPVVVESFQIHAMFEEKYGHYNRLYFDKNDFQKSANIIIDHIKAIRIAQF